MAQEKKSFDLPSPSAVHSTVAIGPNGENYLALQEDTPPEVVADIKLNFWKIYASLFFLNGSVLWAYYSCLSAQFYYESQFPKVKFSFLVTLFTAWPMVAGHFINIVFGFDKKLGITRKIIIGYAINIFCAVVILLQNFLAPSEKTESSDTIRSAIILTCIALIGLANAFTEASFYGISSLFQTEEFTNAVQIGNAAAGLLNIITVTSIRLIVQYGGFSSDPNTISFYIFFFVLITVCLIALVNYFWLIKLPSVKYYFAENDKATTNLSLAKESPAQRISSLIRIGKSIIQPAFSQFFVLFISLLLFPGLGCDAGRSIPKGNSFGPWYCSPGIIGGYNLGDFIGRVICTKKVYSKLSLKTCFYGSLARMLFIPLVVIGMYRVNVFGDLLGLQLGWEMFWNFAIGLTNGLLATITIGKAPLLCEIKDRESAGYVMVLFLYLGIAGGATGGFAIGESLS